MKLCLSFLCLLVAVSNGAMAADVELLASAEVDFSQRMYQEVALDRDNAVLSPLSIHMDLSLAMLGARGVTSSEMATTLGLDVFSNDMSAHQAYKQVITQMNSVAEVFVSLANAIYVNPNTELRNEYTVKAENYYKAKVGNFDPQAPGGPEKEINEYVEDQTKGQIEDLLEPGTINDNTVALLINTLFFNGTWATQFDKEKTQLRNFYTRGETIQLSTIYDQRTVNIKRGVHGADVAELPFVNDRFSLYIALPHDIDGIHDLESALANTGAVDDLFTNLVPTRVNLTIPKFRIESSFNLNSALKELGMIQAFDVGLANFEGMSDSGNVYISDTIHKAVIEFTERGTVAAATTAVIISTLSLQQPPQEIFKTDHPFLVFLRDKQLELILFQGKFSS